MLFKVLTNESYELDSPGYLVIILFRVVNIEFCEFTVKFNKLSKNFIFFILVKY